MVKKSLIFIFITVLGSAVKGSSLCPTSFFYFPHGPLLTEDKFILTGPYWTILRQAYDLCCPLNVFAKKAINPIRSPSKEDLAEKILNSYTREIINSVAFANLNLYVTNTTGMFGIIDSASSSSTSGHNFNKLDNFVSVMSSEGFYLISKHEINGFPTTIPIVYELILKAWPLLVIIILINGYSSFIFWSIDKILGLEQFPRPFIQGFAYGLWWLTCIMFSPSSMTAKSTTIRAWIMRFMILIWLGICYLMLVICIGVMAAGLTLYALNGRSLSQKVIGIEKYSPDKTWLKMENAQIQEYDTVNEMLSDLNSLKLDYILVDTLYAKFYAKIIAEQFYISRHVHRSAHFSLLLRGFHKENINCFQAVTVILTQRWLNHLHVSASYKIKDTKKYFDVTEELLSPQLNICLLFSVGLLIILVVAGSVWQFTCMKKVENFYSYAFKSGGFNAFFKDDSKKSDENSLNFYDRALINARNQVIMRQQLHSSSDASSGMQSSSSLKESDYYRNSCSYLSLPPVDLAQNYIQLQHKFKEKDPQDKIKARRKNLRICSRIMNKKQLQGEQTPRYRFFGVSSGYCDSKRSFVKKSSEVFSIETSEEIINKKKLLMNSSAGAVQLTEMSRCLKNSPQDSTVNTETDDSQTGSFYLGQFLSVKL